MQPELSLPARSVARHLMLAAGLALLFLTAWESFWRARGFVPALDDSAALWGQERLRANRSGARALAVVGSSRFQSGIDPVGLKAELPEYAPVQLAMVGSSSLPILHDLAEDPAFHGSVLVEVMPSSFFPPGARAPTARQREWIGYARSTPLLGPVELGLRRELRTHFVFPATAVHPQQILRKLWFGDGRLPVPPYWSLRADRFRPVDYSRVDVEEKRQHWKNRFSEAIPVSERELDPLLEALRVWVDKIHARGGEVVFVRMISSPPVLDIEDQFYPRERYFARLVTAGFKAIEFRELLGVERLSCADGSHLEAAGAASFTAILGQEMRRRRWLAPAP